MKHPVLLFDFDDTLSEQSAFVLQYVCAIGETLAPRFGGGAEDWTQAAVDMLQTLEAQYVARFCPDPTGYNAWYDTMHTQAMALVFGGMGLPVPPDAETLSRETQYHALSRCDACFEGARDVIRSLHAAGYPLHLASGNDSGHLRGAMAGAGLAPYLDRLFGPDLIDCAKEGPEYYFRVFRALDIPPADALVIDNDPNAIGWAQAVGAQAVQADFLPHRPIEIVPGVVARITDISQLPALVAQVEQDRAAKNAKNAKECVGENFAGRLSPMPRIGMQGGTQQAGSGRRTKGKTDMAIDTKYQARPIGYITYEQYLENGGENHCTEWIDGKVIDISMVSDEHSDITLFVLVLLRLWVEEHQAGVVRGEPFNMKTGPGLPGRSPDAMFIAEANRHRLRRSFLDGPCDLAVEIVSPDYRRADTVEKLAEYAQGGVPEYWVVDYELQQARFYGLNADAGVYEEIPVGQDGIFHSRILPGLQVTVAWFWQRPLPMTRELQRVWNLP